MTVLIVAVDIDTLLIGATMACSSIDINTCIDGALTLLGKFHAMVEKMIVAEEVKRAAPPDALSS
jgi:hypothetical protein